VVVDPRLSPVAHWRKTACLSENRHPVRGKTEAPRNPVKEIGQKTQPFLQRTGPDSLTD
jgi:hypothetical protein